MLTSLARLCHRYYAVLIIYGHVHEQKANGQQWVRLIGVATLESHHFFVVLACTVDSSYSLL